MIYSICCSDTFDENTPPVDDPQYISSLGAAIFRGMQSGDNNAVWLMQVQKKKGTILWYLYFFHFRTFEQSNLTVNLFLILILILLCNITGMAIFIWSILETSTNEGYSSLFSYSFSFFPSNWILFLSFKSE